ncbi:MAG TPA: hypothetical protein VHE83_01780 [Mycobacteriales bacterium]|nr:hypothetical protein [Mycobacteriales bacterium]
MERRRPSTVLVELLRFCLVLAFAGIGFEVGRSLSNGHGILGPFDGLAIGVIVGSGLGYVVGGMVGRQTVKAVEATTSRLRDVSAEQLLAGALGTAAGMLAGAAFAWPVLLAPSPVVTLPVFGFVILTIGLLGSRLGMSRRHSVLAMLGAARGVAPRPAPAIARERVLDRSVAVDGRLLDVVRAGWLSGTLLLPAPMISDLEQQATAQARRGLDVLERLRREPDVDVEVIDVEEAPDGGLPASLVRLCLDRGATLLTADRALAKAARLAGVPVLDLPALADALRPPVAVGDELTVHLVRAGKENGQAVGFLEDGTMVVVERAKSRVGREVTMTVASIMVGDKGRIAFGELKPTPAEAVPVQAAAT